ncbi:MAG: hypothetical protein ACLFNU_11540 [Bacteroidales bacterium]
MAHPHCTHYQSPSACPELASVSQRSSQSFFKELAKFARVTAFQDGLKITHNLFILNGVRESLRLFTHAQKNKINLCFVDRLMQIENDKKKKLNK